MIKRPITRKIIYVLFGTAFFILMFAAFPGSFSAAKAFLKTNQYIAKVGDVIHPPADKDSMNEGALNQDNSLKTNTTTVEPAQEIPAAELLGPNQYIVASDDSLKKVSEKFNTTVSELKWANSLEADTIKPGQVLDIPINQESTLSDIIDEKGIDLQTKGLEIYVDKSDHVLGLISNGTFLKSYHVELGDNGLEDKEISGDHKTPEGTFYISEKSVLDPSDEYLGSRWMRLSYPNIEDANRGLKDGIISNGIYHEIVNAFRNLKTPPQNTPLGGGVGIHGGSTAELGSDWTWGCVGLTNSSVEDFYNYVKVGTKVVIQK